MNLLEELRNLEPDFRQIKRVSMLNAKSEVVGWSAYAYGNDDRCLAGGTSQSYETALRICVAELFERKMVARVNASPQKEEFLMKEFESTCGFAAGFDREKTLARSTCEAIERWAWSKWIDEGHKPEFLSSAPTISALTTHCLSVFVKVIYAEKRFVFNDLEYTFGALIGLTEDGAFIGSRVCHRGEDPWEHASIEAYRSFLTATNQRAEAEGLYAHNIAWRRTIYFAKNRGSAEEQMFAATRTDWPKLSAANYMSKEWNTGITGLYVFRSVFTDYLSWDIGPDSRFVY